MSAGAAWMVVRILTVNPLAAESITSASAHTGPRAHIKAAYAMVLRMVFLLSKETPTVVEPEPLGFENGNDCAEMKLCVGSGCFLSRRRHRRPALGYFVSFKSPQHKAVNLHLLA